MLRRNLRQHATLLRVRKRQEDLKAQAMAVARREVALAKGARLALRDERQRMFGLAGSTARETFDADEVRRYYQHERHLAQRTDSKDAEIVELEAKAEERRAELEEAMKGRRVIEKLGERRQAALVKETRKEEQRFNDEVATNRSAMRRSGRR